MLSRQWDVGKAWNGGTNVYGWRSGWKGRDFGDNDPQWTPDTIEGYPTVKTRYIRVDIEAMRTAAFDEIEVYGYETPQDGAYVVEPGSGRDLDNGRDYLTAGDRTSGVQDMVLCYNGWYGWDAVGEEGGVHLLLGGGACYLKLGLFFEFQANLGYIRLGGEPG